jgi:hypothetical protein
LEIGEEETGGNAAFNEVMNDARAQEDDWGGRWDNGKRRGKMHAGEGGGGECVDDGDVRDANADETMIVMILIIIIKIAWLNGKESSQGDRDEDAPLLPPSMAITISEMQRRRMPAERCIPSEMRKQWRASCEA